MQVQITNDDGDRLTLERDAEGNLTINLRTADNKLLGFLVPKEERTKLAEMVEAL